MQKCVEVFFSLQIYVDKHFHNSPLKAYGDFSVILNTMNWVSTGDLLFLHILVIMKQYNRIYRNLVLCFTSPISLMSLHPIYTANNLNRYHIRRVLLVPLSEH